MENTTAYGSQGMVASGSDGGQDETTSGLPEVSTPEASTVLEEEEEEYPDRVPDEQVDMVPYRPVQYSEEEMQQRAEDFYQLMSERRSCRFFSEKPVDISIIRRMIHTAGTAPSGAHTEPWTYVVVSDPEMKKAVRNIVEDEEETRYRQRTDDVLKNDLRRLNINNRVRPYLEGAPFLILLFKQVYGLTSSGERKTHYYNEISVSISAGILLAAIQNVGLVTVTSTPLNAGPRLTELLGRPKNEKLLMLLPVGYPSGDAVVPGVRRKPEEGIIMHL